MALSIPEKRRNFTYHEDEWMDRPQPVSWELETTLRELEFLNRRFGGHRFLRRFLKSHMVPRPTYRVLDLATGGGDFPRVMVDWARSRGLNLVVDAVDSGKATVALARKFSADYPEIHFMQEDVRTYRAPYQYDLVHCSLALHHFGTADAVHVLRRCRELSRGWILVTDLERSFWTGLGIRLANTLLRHQPMTIHDGDVSGQRSFSFREFRMLAKGAGWVGFHHQRFVFCRQALSMNVLAK